MRVAHKAQVSKKKGFLKKKRPKTIHNQVDVELALEAEVSQVSFAAQRRTAVAVVLASALFTLVSIYVVQLWPSSPSDSLGLVLSGAPQPESFTSDNGLPAQHELAGRAQEVEVGSISGGASATEDLLNVLDAHQRAPMTAIPQSINHVRQEPLDNPISITASSRLPPMASRQPGNFKHPRILWIHLHGYGGTTICDMARSQGEKVARAQDNCNIMPDLCSTPKVFRTPCKKRASSLQYTFTAIERAVDDDDLACVGHAASNTGPVMLFGVMLRDPLAGIKSTWIGNELEKDLILTAIRTQTRPKNFQYHFCLPPFDTFQHFDNFAVRTLSGDYDVAPGTVSRWHLTRAKEVLSKIDVVLILEQLTDHLPQLHAVFGWGLGMENPGRSHRHRIPKNAMSPDEERYLRQINALDYELYEFGKDLALQRTAQARLRSVSI